MCSCGIVVIHILAVVSLDLPPRLDYISAFLTHHVLTETHAL